MVSEKEITKVLSILRKYHKPIMLEQLKKFTVFQRLIATLLSARAKDATTIPIVKDLFKKYPGPEELAKIDAKELEKKIYKIGFYKNKAKNVKNLSLKLIEEHKGKVPKTLEGLISLPGVGKKTANCILGYAFGKPAIAVDTHVHKISNRLGWVKTRAPEKTEEELMKIVPKRLWVDVNAMFVDHGQRVCLPVRPKCKECKISEYCDYGKEVLGKLDN